MSDGLQTLAEDIGFLRALAQQPPAARAEGGRYLIAGGVIFAAASVGHYAIAEGLLGALPSWTIAGIWGAATLVFFAALSIFIRQDAAIRRASGVQAKAFGQVWSAVGWTIFAFFGCLQLIVWRTHDITVVAVIPSVIMTLYGLAWSVGASLVRRGWMWSAAIGAYVAALGSAFLCTQAVAYLWYAAALLIVVALPGVVIMRAARRGA